MNTRATAAAKTLTVADQSGADAEIPKALADGPALDLTPIKRRLASASAGPWRWELNRSSKCVQLCGGIPRFDLTVIDFERWGMNGAAPRFNAEVRTNLNVMQRAEIFGVDQPGREHHSDWFQLLKHPDAALIENAPADLAALIAEVESLRSGLALLGPKDSGRTLDGVEHDGGGC